MRKCSEAVLSAGRIRYNHTRANQAEQSARPPPRMFCRSSFPVSTPDTIPPPTTPDRQSPEMTGGHHTAHTQPKKSGAKNPRTPAALVMFPRYPHRPRTRFAHMISHVLRFIRCPNRAQPAPAFRISSRKTKLLPKISRPHASRAPRRRRPPTRAPPHPAAEVVTPPPVR